MSSLLRPPIPNMLERVLVMGGPGSGKTHSWMSIARRAQQTKSDAKFYVIDTDFSVPRMLMDPAFSDLTNIEHKLVTDWADLDLTLDTYYRKLHPQDWLVIDMVSAAWEYVQNHYSEARYGKDYAEHMLDWASMQKPGEKKGGPAFERDIDWTAINALYKGKIANRILRAPANVFCTTQVKPIDEKREDPAVKAIFEKHGVKPEGQKHLGHLFHTVLLTSETKAGKYRLMTIKDRSREKMVGQEIPDFAMGYLVKIAGWKL